MVPNGDTSIVPCKGGTTVSTESTSRIRPSSAFTHSLKQHLKTDVLFSVRVIDLLRAYLSISAYLFSRPSIPIPCPVLSRTDREAIPLRP